MATLTQLEAPNANISNLTGLEHATSLTRLDLGADGQAFGAINSNSVSDLSPLMELTNLTWLRLRNNSISNIAPLAGLTNLTWLNLGGNTISSISSLSGLTNLITLYLWGNDITSISALSGLTNLTALLLDDNRISDLSPLSGLTNLTDLWLEGNSISDISALSGLTNLTHLWLEGNSISDISALSGLTNLTHLVLDDNRISDLSPLSSGLTNLTHLVLDDNRISDLSPLVSNRGLGSGDAVYVRENPLNAVSINTHLPTLQGRGVVVLFDASAPSLKGDVNGDGVVNIQDLVLAARRLGQRGQNDADMNGDGVVNIQDLVLVAGAFGNTAAPSALDPQALTLLTAADVQGWLAEVEQTALTDAAYLRGIAVLQQLLSVLTPKETALLPNYPNPFNPETWIPYHLAEAADVQVTIYDIQGTVVRLLELGYQPAGYYTDRSKAVYWDGRNQFGESVASGVYFYTLTVRSETRSDNFTATRQMLILK